MKDCVSALKQWTGKANATILFDSTVDEFTDDGLFNKVKGRPNIAVIGFTTDGDVFGFYFNVVVTEQNEEFHDPNTFVFSFESHGRCMTPQRFVVKEGRKHMVTVRFCKNNEFGFVDFWVVGTSVGFYLGDESSNSWCFGLSSACEGIQDTTLTGTSDTWVHGPYHHCIRLVAVQLS